MSSRDGFNDAKLSWNSERSDERTAKPSIAVLANGGKDFRLLHLRCKQVLGFIYFRRYGSLAHNYPLRRSELLRVRSCAESSKIRPECRSCRQVGALLVVATLSAQGADQELTYNMPTYQYRCTA